MAGPAYPPWIGARHTILGPSGGSVSRIPVSRHTEVRHEDLPSETRVLAHSAEAGLCLIEDPIRNGLYIFNHLEYDRDTLSREYHRDRAAGRSVPLPCNYFPNDDASRRPLNQWRAAGRTLYGNWLQAVYRKSGLAPAMAFAFQGVARSAAS